MPHSLNPWHRDRFQREHLCAQQIHAADTRRPAQHGDDLTVRAAQMLTLCNKGTQWCKRSRSYGGKLVVGLELSHPTLHDFNTSESQVGLDMF